MMVKIDQMYGGGRLSRVTSEKIVADGAVEAESRGTRCPRGAIPHDPWSQPEM